MKVSDPEGSSDSDNGTMLLDRQRQVKLARQPLGAFLLRLAREVAGGRNFSVCLVSDAVMRRYNRRFRAKDVSTDVLSFPGNSSGWAGDLLISAETARRQARRLGHPAATEIKILALHGLLHLLGYDHEAKRDWGRMARAERRWRKRLGLPLGLIERASV